MAKEQLLIISPPSEINFKGPYGVVVTERLTLTNPTDSPIAFKVKTTAPKRYCVRPNNGFVPPKKQVVVSVMLQPQNKDEILLEKHKHKFMIQSVISNVENGTVEDIFKQSSPGEVMDSKFRCVFEDINDEKPKSPDFNQALSRVDMTESNVKTTAQENTNENRQEKSSSLNEGSIKVNPHTDGNQANTGTAGSTTGTNVSSTVSSNDGRVKDLAEENKKLILEIQNLRSQVKNSGGISGAIPVVAQQHQPQGTSSFLLVLIVGIIALFIGLFLGMSRQS